MRSNKLVALIQSITCSIHKRLIRAYMPKTHFKCFVYRGTIYNISSNNGASNKITVIDDFLLFITKLHRLDYT